MTQSKYRCETCNYYLTYAIACNKIKERLIVGSDEWIDKVGCASHSDFQIEREKINCPHVCDSVCIENVEEHDKLVLEKVLKLLEEYINEFAREREGDNGYSETCIDVDHLKKWFIEELRSEQE